MKLRRKHLMEAYRKVAPECSTQKQAYERTVKSPAPQFYITADHARHVVSPMLHGDFRLFNTLPPNKKRMYQALCDTVLRLAETRAYFGKSLTYIIPYAIQQPAPEFFIDAQWFRRIYNHRKYFETNDTWMPYRRMLIEKRKLKGLNKKNKKDEQK